MGERLFRMTTWVQDEDTEGFYVDEQRLLTENELDEYRSTLILNAADISGGSLRVTLEEIVRANIAGDN